MDRKDFLKKGLLGTGMFVATAAVGNIMKNKIDEIQELKPLDTIISLIQNPKLWKTQFYTKQIQEV